jgi:hypothetical protein
MTPFPNAEDYVRAVQDPRRTLRYPALQRAEFALHPLLQIPMPASGTAAVVFKARIDGAEQAMRFFIREDASNRQRYTALGRYFVDHDLGDCVASATWVDDAISINNLTWPMVQMSWVNGRTLDAYISYLVDQGDVAALGSLAATWRNLIDRLKKAEFAHGDLQHGNVLIDTESTLRLVDFDGSWIKTFCNEKPPSETGHRNYQRSGRKWDQWMDTFPGLVIYTALLGLSKNPGSWSRLSTGENILFSQQDFAEPFQTNTWKYLSTIGDPEVDHLANRLKECCMPNWRATGPLEEILTGRPFVVAAGPTTVTTSAPIPVSDRAVWWELTAPMARQFGGPTTAATTSTSASGPLGGPSMPAPPLPEREFVTPPATDRPTAADHSEGGRSSTPWFERAAGADGTKSDTRMPALAAILLALGIALLSATGSWAIVHSTSARSNASLVTAIVVAAMAFALSLIILRRSKT